MQDFLGSGADDAAPCILTTVDGPVCTRSGGTRPVLQREDDDGAAPADDAPVPALRAPAKASEEDASPTSVATPTGVAAPTTVAQFTATLYEILGEDKSEVHCHWSDDGERVVFLDSDAFARDVCPRYFRHSKWTSFTSMLYKYEFRATPHGFRKVSTGSTRHEFAHEFFTRDRKDLLNRVQRKRRASPRVEDSPDSDVGQPAP